MNHLKLKYHKKFFIYFVLGIIAISSYGYHRYNILPSEFMIDDTLFHITDNILEVKAIGDKENTLLLGDKIGVITRQTIFYPRNNQEGFKVPEGSIVYKINKESPLYSDHSEYTVIIRTPENSLHRAYLGTKDQDSIQEAFERFDELYN